MKSNLRSACVSLVRSSTNGSGIVRTPRPAALGWKLQSGMLPAAELRALYESVHGALTGGASATRRWVPSAPLRALLAEYQAVRRASARLPECTPRCRRVSRPADCA